MMKEVEGLGAFHAELVEAYVRGYFMEGRAEAAAAIVRAYRTEAGQAVLWANGSPRRFEAGPWRALWEMGVNLS
jgi:hypothetical protein